MDCNKVKIETKSLYLHSTEKNQLEVCSSCLEYGKFIKLGITLDATNFEL